MRWIALLLCTASPAAAWEFTPGLPCVLSDLQGETQIELTYDPRGPLYSITVTPSEPWGPGDEFSITYEGAQGSRIATTRHRLSEDGRSLTVEDRGFGNVLMGMERNTRAIARLGQTDVEIDLRGAADPVRAFRACSTAPSA